MTSPDRRSIAAARQALSQARLTRLAAQASLSAQMSSASSLKGTRPAQDPKLQTTLSAVAQQRQSISRARAAEKSAAADVAEALGQFLAPNISKDIERLESTMPLVLLPVRLETRFDTAHSQLLVRIYPDEISADSHEPELSAAEAAAGQAYWASAPGGVEALTAWQLLLQTYPSTRAAWIVEATDPSNGGSGSAFDKPAGWSRAVEARLLPDRFTVVATRTGITRQQTGSVIVEPIALSVGPDTLTADQVPIGPDGNFKLDEAVLWTVDFAKAEANGMAIRLALDADDLRLGFDRVLVVGLRTSTEAVDSSVQLGALLDSHHYTDGLSFMKQGTPTSNTIGAPAGFPVADPNGAISFDIERGAALNTASDSAGVILSAALGLSSAHFNHVAGANLAEATSARMMNRVLFSATLGYFLDQIMSPLMNVGAVNEIGQYFSQWVLPRGLCSAIRIGRVPYGILPTTSTAVWQDDERASPVRRQLAAVVKKLRPLWQQFNAKAPHVGRSQDPDQDLLDVLAMDAGAREVRVRRVVGNGTWLNLLQLLGWPAAEWEAVHQTIGGAALAAAGLPAGAHPKVLDLNFGAKSSLYHGELTDTQALSETTGLGARDYITWVRQATIAQLHLESLPAGMDAGIKQVLLYRFLRHSALAEYSWWGNRLLEQYATAPMQAWSEAELVGIVPGTEARLTPWQRFDAPANIPSIGAISIAQFLDGDDETQLRALTGVGDFRDALSKLAPLATAELGRLFSESLDSVSHRLDAWITALATERLGQIRSARNARGGCYVGSYGWVENLRPEASNKIAPARRGNLRTTPGGYIQGPSMAHAMTAAVMRNAYLTHLGQGAQSPFAVDLSSSQVRKARFVLDSVRNGQPVGAVYGYLLERRLHEALAESLIDPIRNVAPLVANQIEDSGMQAELVAARNVVDGLALYKLWKSGKLFGTQSNMLPVNIAHRDILDQQLALLEGDIDAVADILLAESVHQIVRGSTMASGAGLDALAQGTRPPDPDVGRGISGGTTLTHRVAVVFGAAAAPLSAGWPATKTPRAQCEPRLDTWAAGLLGDPSNVKCTVSYPNSAAGNTHVPVSFNQLLLCALDVLSLATSVATSPAASELDRRVLFAAFGDAIPADAASGASFSIVYTADPSWNRATTRTFPEFLDLANAVAALAAGTRSLIPVDIVLPEQASEADAAVIDTAEAQARVQAAGALLQAAEANLKTAIAAVPVTVPPTMPSDAAAAAIRKALRAGALFGIAACFPPFLSGTQEGAFSLQPLLDQANNALAAMQLKLSQAAQAGDVQVQAQAVFSKDFRLLTGFKFDPMFGAGAQLAQALAYSNTMLAGDVHAVERWLMGAERIREPLGRWRVLRLLADSNGSLAESWTVAQLPHDPTASWIALPPNPGENRSSGKLSVEINLPSGPVDLTQNCYGLFLDEWVETIPNASEHTGIAFRYDDTAGEAPQCILLAICPTTAPNWDFDSLLAVLNETLDNAKMRALDLSALDPLAQLIPAVYLAANSGDETIATQLLMRLDPAILKGVQS